MNKVKESGQVMDPQALIGKLGVRMALQKGKTVGAPPSVWATVIKSPKGPAIWVANEDTNTLVIALHEAVHLVLGPESLEDEASHGFLAVEMALAGCLDVESWKCWRKEFSLYNLEPDGPEVGMTNKIFQSRVWEQQLRSAWESGYFRSPPSWDNIRHGRKLSRYLKWENLRVHSDWKEFRS